MQRSGKSTGENGPGDTKESTNMINLHAAAGVNAETASTLQEGQGSAKVGDGKALCGANMAVGSLDRVRADAQRCTLTTNQGVPIADNTNSLKAGLRGPTLMEDFILREKITHFDHERIPERVVHARGSGAHGIFECTEAITDVTCAKLFAEAGKRTPVFVRFSTVLGARGSTDLARDTRGFATKFYTEQGNWDLVGNNIPVFFIQDAIRFPDIVHAAKPEQHHDMPQAASAHDTFWDFFSLNPETVHHTLWNMSDRGIPRSYRTMQGFGVNTYRLVNQAGAAVFVKFHWLPAAGTHSVVWDEAVKISGADPDFHRRDLWEAIETGAFPQWDLAIQTVTEEQAEAFDFDILDATKLIPEELVPLRVVGRLTLNRNPDNFFAETEQVAFCVSNVVPGIDFSNDPLLQGRLFSYLDTQLLRLGGPNFHEIPINTPIVNVQNNQRDGPHRMTINRGRTNYDTNSLGRGCPFMAGRAGFISFPEQMREDKVRGKPEKFADHYSQARLFYASQTPVEKQHIINAFRFELSRVTVVDVRERALSVLANVAQELAQAVADGLGLPVPPPQPTLVPVRDSQVASSQALSLFARTGDGNIQGRKVALLVADGCEAKAIHTVAKLLTTNGAVPRIVSTKFGKIATADGDPLEVATTVEAMPSVLWDGVVVSATHAKPSPALWQNGMVRDFLREQFRHCKTILFLGDPAPLLATLGKESPALPDGSEDPGLILGQAGSDAAGLAEAFVTALGRHRHFARETDPPLV
eukprot:m.157187 g.157187  ORF g.157187 m.157187 type:complete len:755 (-) comp17002_c0_seq2:2496-4760(-)